MSRTPSTPTNTPPFVSLENVTMTFGPKSLFEDLSLAVHPGERIGIIGRNGSGKSTLIRLLLGEIEPHKGNRSARRSLTFAYVPQNFEFRRPTVAEEIAEAIEQFRAQQARSRGGNGNHLDAFSSENLVNGALKFANLEELADRAPSRCSGGQRKRLQIVCALLQEPSVLIMDEPTNHLDVETTEWLEDAVLSVLESPRSLLWGSIVEKSWDPAFVLVSHDRSLLDTLVTSLIELDRGEAQVFEGGYESYLVQKMERESANRSAEARAANTMRRELEWVSRGAQARSTKQRARIERAQKLNTKLGLMRSRNKEIGSLGLDFVPQTESSGGMRLSKQNLIEFRKLHVERKFEDRTDVYFDGLDLTLRPGMRLALLGPNGCGKSTFFENVTQSFSNPRHDIVLHEHAHLSYFDQERTVLNTVRTPRDLLLPAGGDTVHTGGRSVHIATFLAQFQFLHQDLDAPLTGFSGGERARFLLAKTLLDGANVLIMDEPTNDLDLWVLRDLEQSLCDFNGTLVFTSHDRYFLRRVATQFLAFAGWTADNTGLPLRRARWIVTADLDQALEASRTPQAPRSTPSQTKSNSTSQGTDAPSEASAASTKSNESRPKKMTYKDQFRQSELERLIPEWELERDTLSSELETLYAKNAPFEATKKTSDALQSLVAKIDAAYEEFEQIISRSQEP